MLRITDTHFQKLSRFSLLGIQRFSKSWTVVGNPEGQTQNILCMCHNNEHVENYRYSFSRLNPIQLIGHSTFLEIMVCCRKPWGASSYFLCSFRDEHVENNRNSNSRLNRMVLSKRVGLSRKRPFVKSQTKTFEIQRSSISLTVVGNPKGANSVILCLRHNEHVENNRNSTSKWRRVGLSRKKLFVKSRNKIWGIQGTSGHTRRYFGRPGGPHGTIILCHLATSESSSTPGTLEAVGRHDVDAFPNNILTNWDIVFKPLYAEWLLWNLAPFDKRSKIISPLMILEPWSMLVSGGI